MTIKQYLQEGQYTRLSHNDRWIYWDADGWHVMEHKPYQRGSTELLITKDEKEAIAKLIEGDEGNFSQKDL